MDYNRRNTLRPTKKNIELAIKDFNKKVETDTKTIMEIIDVKMIDKKEIEQVCLAYNVILNILLNFDTKKEQQSIIESIKKDIRNGKN